jgi:hypothetical protein
MNRLALVAATMAAAVAFNIGAQERRPVADAIGAMKRHVGQQCSFARQQDLPALQGFEKEAIGAMLEMNCVCMPGEIERAAADLTRGDENAMTTKDAFVARMRTASATCAARLVRGQILERCEAEDVAALGVQDQQGYCGCVAERVRGLDDEALATAAATSHRNFQRRALARKQGEPEPVAVRTAVDDIKDACRDAPR